MCGRYVSPDEAAIERVWHIGRHNNDPFSTRYNVQPTTTVPLIRRTQDSIELELTQARWGLIPHWWKDQKPPRLTFNARSEEAAAKPMWRHPLAHGRCLIPALGWYEWREADQLDQNTGEVRKIRQPYFLHLPGNKLFCFAGLMSYGQVSDSGKPGLSCSILTRAASPSVAAVHDRMPVILPDEAHEEWLDPLAKDEKQAIEVARRNWLDDFQNYPVSLLVNSARNEGETLIEPLH
jgi:putative SOS response-associated peptidase YedK